MKWEVQIHRKHVIVLFETNLDRWVKKYCRSVGGAQISFTYVLYICIYKMKREVVLLDFKLNEEKAKLGVR